MSHFRTCYNNDIDKSMLNQQVVLCGWVLRRRDHGGVIFIDLRDRSGFCQVVFRPEVSAEAHKAAEDIRSEYVIRVEGKVIPRTEENINPNMKTGELEVEVEKLDIQSVSRTPVFTLDPNEKVDVHEDIRLKYRFLDMRRNVLKDNLVQRHYFSQAVRKIFTEEGFIEVETPALNKATPEGARDFVVPSRLNKNTFYALPQSPQIFKQILMVGGMERYFQIVKCFRDEDLRADRQPEFTQIDVEMSFLTRDELMELMEKVIIQSLKEVFPDRKYPEGPVPRLDYYEAMERYGSDKPDTRFAMELVNVEEAVKDCEFQVFQNVIKSGGIIRAICVKNGKELSRKDIDDYIKFVGQYGAKGMAWMRVTENGLESNIVKFFPEASQEALIKTCGAEPGDLLMFVAENSKVVYTALGALRLDIARKMDLIDPDRLDFLWVNDFPLFEWDARDKRYYSVHHPFTMPREEDMDLLDKEPEKVRSQAYDFVLNGNELGGGSVRIHSSEVQEKIFTHLGISSEEAEEKFGFLLEALRFGAPPHGGIAFGLDRIMMIMQKTESIRDVIAFPKTQRGQCLMSDSPSPVSADQLDELSISLIKE